MEYGNFTQAHLKSCEEIKLLMKQIDVETKTTREFYEIFPQFKLQGIWIQPHSQSFFKQRISATKLLRSIQGAEEMIEISQRRNDVQHQNPTVKNLKRLKNSSYDLWDLNFKDNTNSDEIALKKLFQTLWSRASSSITQNIMPQDLAPRELEYVRRDDKHLKSEINLSLQGIKFQSQTAQKRYSLLPAQSALGGKLIKKNKIVVQLPESISNMRQRSRSTNRTFNQGQVISQRRWVSQLPPINSTNQLPKPHHRQYPSAGHNYFVNLEVKAPPREWLQPIDLILNKKPNIGKRRK